jgi:hypothetical protein
MIKHTVRILLVTLALSTSATGVAAAIVSLQTIGGSSGTYVPGSSVLFEVRLPAMSNLGAYNIDVSVDGDSGTVGSDYYFDRSATRPPDSGYVFPSAVNYAVAVNADSVHRQRLTLTDFDLTGVDVVPAANDLVALVLLQTSPDSRAELSLSIDVMSLILDTPTPTPTPVDEFAAIRDAIAVAEPIRLISVPEPYSLASLFAGSITAFAMLHEICRRKAHAAA